MSFIISLILMFWQNFSEILFNASIEIFFKRKWINWATAWVIWVFVSDSKELFSLSSKQLINSFVCSPALFAFFFIELISLLIVGDFPNSSTINFVTFLRALVTFFSMQSFLLMSFLLSLKGLLFLFLYNYLS